MESNCLIYLMMQNIKAHPAIIEPAITANSDNIHTIYINTKQFYLNHNATSSRHMFIKKLLLLMTFGRSDSPNHEGVACQLT